MTGERRPRGVNAAAFLVAVFLLLAVCAAVTAGLVALWRAVL